MLVWCERKALLAGCSRTELGGNGSLCFGDLERAVFNSKKGVSCVHVKIYFSVIRFNLSLLLLLVLFEGHIGQS